MGIKDKLKRTSRIFISDSKEDVAENGKAAAGTRDIDEATENTTGSVAVHNDSPEGIADHATDNADGTLASSGDQDEGAARDAAHDVLDPAQAAAADAGEEGGEPDAENGAVKRRSSFKRIKSKAKKPAVSGEAKRTEFFQKLLKKFKRPVGASAGKSEEKSADITAEETTEANVTKAEAKAEVDAEEATDAAVAAPEISLDPATESAATGVVADAAGTTEPVK